MLEDFGIRYELITKGPPHHLAGYFIYGRWARGRTLAKLIRLHFTKKQEIIWDGRTTERESGTGSEQTRVSAVLIYINSLLPPGPAEGRPTFCVLRRPRSGSGEAVKGRSGVRSCSRGRAGRFAEGRKLAEEGAVARVIDCGIAAGRRCQEGQGRKDGRGLARLLNSRASPQLRARTEETRGGRVESIQERAMFSFNSPNGQHRFTESHCTGSGWVGTVSE